MVASRKFVISLAAVLAAAALAAGCESMGLEGPKDVFMGKPAPSPDLPEHPKLVMPPQNAGLPVPRAGYEPAMAGPDPARPNTQAANAVPAAAPAADAPKKEGSSGWLGGWFGGSKTQ